ncbi:MAG: hypothetical protein WCT04_15405 [Planctomycetota bacterium]
MKNILTLALFLSMCSLQVSANESGHRDHEAPLVKDGVLGTVNVLRELDVKTGKNRVTVEGNYKFATDWFGGPVESTIDGSAIPYNIRVASDPEVITYTLPGLRTVSSLVIQYWEGQDAAETVRLEGSPDGGKSWTELLKSKPRKTDFLKCFKPAKVNQLRLTLEGESGKLRRITEVFVYADPETPVPLFGGKESGAFSFLRDLWYAGKINQLPSPAKHAVWTQSWGGMARPHSLFISEMASAHDGCWGEGKEAGKRVYLRFDLDKVYSMNFGLIGCYPMPKGREELILAGDSEVEFYTANGTLDPSTLKGSTIKDLTSQGWILQKAWSKDPGACKSFPMEHPGQYNQMLLVWDSKKTYEYNRFSHFEMFGAEASSKDGSTDKQQ